MGTPLGLAASLSGEWEGFCLLPWWILGQIAQFPLSQGGCSIYTDENKSGRSVIGCSVCVCVFCIGEGGRVVRQEALESLHVREKEPVSLPPSLLPHSLCPIGALDSVQSMECGTRTSPGTTLESTPLPPPLPAPKLRDPPAA